MQGVAGPGRLPRHRHRTRLRQSTCISDAGRTTGGRRTIRRCRALRHTSRASSIFTSLAFRPSVLSDAWACASTAAQCVSARARYTRCRDRYSSVVEVMSGMEPSRGSPPSPSLSCTPTRSYAPSIVAHNEDPCNPLSQRFIHDCEFAIAASDVCVPQQVHQYSSAVDIH